VKDGLAGDLEGKSYARRNVQLVVVGSASRNAVGANLL
jgi:hypothetical protein